VLLFVCLHLLMELVCDIERYCRSTLLVLVNVHVAVVCLKSRLALDMSIHLLVDVYNSSKDLVRSSTADTMFIIVFVMHRFLSGVWNGSVHAL